MLFADGKSREDLEKGEVKVEKEKEEVKDTEKKTEEVNNGVATITPATEENKGGKKNKKKNKKKKKGANGPDSKDDLTRPSTASTVSGFASQDGSNTYSSFL